MKVVFFGTPDFAAQALKYLLENKVNVVAVVTRPDKPKGRSGRDVPSPVKDLANEHYLPIHQPAKASDPEFAPILQSYDADLFVVVAYGEIIKQHLLDMPKMGCINVHASLLPKYRGAAPIQHAIINGETETGVTIMHMVLKMDAGDIIKVKKVPIGPDTNAGELFDALSKEGSHLLLDVINDFSNGSVNETPQDHSQATYAPKIELEDCQIDWSKSCEDIHNLVRGVNPHPGAWTHLLVKGAKKRLKILETEPNPATQTIPRKIENPLKNELTVGCGKGTLKILKLKLEGKREMTPKEFLAGHSTNDLEISQ